MKERVFVDASAWISIVYRKDKHHQVAKAIYQRLLDSDVLLVVTKCAFGFDHHFVEAAEQYGFVLKD